jgi:hypothetical protein
MNKTITVIGLFLSMTLITACAPEVGSDAWCRAMEEKAKGDWSTNEAKDYTTNCLFT